jgi:hypothetical protein
MVDIRIGRALNESKINESVMEGLVPNPSGLTDTMNAFLETTDIGFIARNNVAFWFSDVYLFFNKSLRKVVCTSS